MGMRVAIVGHGRLAQSLAEYAGARGREVLSIGPSKADSWPPLLPFRSFETVAEISALLAEQRPDAVVVFGPAAGERSPVPTAKIVAAAGQIASARLLYWGSSIVYDPAAGARGRVLLEEAPLAAGRGVAEAVEADRAAQELVTARRGEVCLFRAAEIVGAGQGTLLAALGRLAVVPVPADHRYLQVLDPRDALEVLDRALGGGHPGIYNVSADGIVKVDEACRALGRSTVRLPRALLLMATYGARCTGRVASARQLLRLTSGTPLMDNARLKTHFGFRPRFTTRQALASARDEFRSPAL